MIKCFRCGMDVYDPVFRLGKSYHARCTFLKAQEIVALSVVEYRAEILALCDALRQQGGDARIAAVADDLLQEVCRELRREELNGLIADMEACAVLLNYYWRQNEARD